MPGTRGSIQREDVLVAAAVAKEIEFVLRVIVPVYVLPSRIMVVIDLVLPQPKLGVIHAVHNAKHELVQATAGTTAMLAASAPHAQTLLQLTILIVSRSLVPGIFVI